MKRTPDTIAALFLLAGLTLACARLAVGCVGGAAEATYTADLLRCVDKAATLAESRACRRHVDGNYGITQTTSDGGTR
jgi:hypothetical protein